MYEIYYNAHRLVLSDQAPGEKKAWSLILHYRGKVPTLHAILDICEKRSAPQYIWIHSSALEGLWLAFRSLFVLIPAAGGLVVNEVGHWLFILRNGVIDLPKGKLEEGENLGEAARREVLEETGLFSVSLGQEAFVTWHLYKTTKKRYLKKTVWFWMDHPVGEVTPQREEGITAIHWLSPKEYLCLSLPRYRSIDALIHNLTNENPDLANT